MTQKRKKYKSNWFIFVMTLIITASMLGLVIFVLRDYLFPTKETGISVDGENKKAAGDSSLNLLAVLDFNEDVPSAYSLISYHAGSGTIDIIALYPRLYIEGDGKSGTVEDIFNKHGAKGLMPVLNASLGIACTNYTVLDKSVFIDLFTSLGNVTLGIPQKISYTNSDLGFSFSAEAGEKLFSSSSLYDYFLYSSLNGDSAGLTDIAAAIMETINQNIANMDLSSIQYNFNRLRDNTTNNFDKDDFKNRKEAINETLDTASAPAAYYVPYGKLNEEGKFLLSDGSLISIQQRMDNS